MDSPSAAASRQRSETMFVLMHQSCLVRSDLLGGLEHEFYIFYLWNVGNKEIPTDWLLFFRGVETTNQLNMFESRVTGWSNLPFGALCLLVCCNTASSKQLLTWMCRLVIEHWWKLARSWFYHMILSRALFFVKHVKPLPSVKCVPIVCFAFALLDILVIGLGYGSKVVSTSRGDISLFLFRSWYPSWNLRQHWPNLLISDFKNVKSCGGLAQVSLW